VPPRSTSHTGLSAPLFLLNLKAYPAAMGRGALALARSLQREGSRAGVAVGLAPSAPDLGWLARERTIPILAQHVDAEPAGPFTGRVVVEALAAAGVRGSLVNHSEHPLPFPLIQKTVERLRSARMVSVVCAKDPAMVRRLLPLHPTYLAIEPPELIGGRRSVSTARPEVITQTVELAQAIAPTTHVLCGAGIHSAHDVRRALALGSEGILVASAVALAPNPARAIRALIAGF